MGHQRSGFDAFFDEHYAPVVRAVALAVGDSAAAEDAVQEAFVRALRKWSTVGVMDRPVGWVYVVAMNVVRRGARRRSRERDVGPARRPVPDGLGAVATRLTIRNALDTLPARQREAVVLRYLADLSVEQTATAMGCAPGTVKSAAHAALQTLRIELEEVDDADG